MPAGTSLSEVEVGSPRTGKRDSAWAAAGVVAFCVGGAAFVAWVLWGGGTPRQRTVISDAAFLPIGPGAALYAYRAARHPGLAARLRRGWSLIAVAALLWGIGDFLWFLLEVVGNRAPFPSVADLFYLGFYPLLASGLALVTPLPLTSGERLRFRLDAVTTVVVAASLAWWAAIAPAMAEPQGWLARSLTVAYPVGDVLLAFGIAAILLRRPPPYMVSALWVLLGAAIAFVSADLLYAHASAAGTYEGGDLPDALWMVALVLFLVAGHVQSRSGLPETESAPRQAIGRVSALPYFAVVAASGLLVAGVAAGGTQLIVAAAAMFLVSVLVAVRQGVAVRDNARLTDELERLASDLERALAETKTAQDVAKDEQERRRRFLADAAHQLRTPVAGLHATVETLLRGAPAATVEDLLQSIGQQSARAGRIISELLTLARLDEDVPLRRTPTDLVALCEDVAERARDRAVGIAVTVATSAVVGERVTVDSNAVRAILTNLLDNAERHAAHSIELTVLRFDATVNVLVRDDGPGLDPDTADDAFERFVSFDGHQGGGLGLAIARGYARAHDGDLRYENGAFVLSLPSGVVPAT